MTWIRRAGLMLLGVLVVLLGLWKLLNAWSFQLVGELHHRVETDEKVVALTFDDGPRPVITEAILDILSRHQVKASFFMVGQRIERNRALAARVLAEGHELGNHSYSHRRLILKSTAFIEEEITKTDALLRELGVKGEIFFRAPFGKKLVGLPWVLARQGRKHITFDVVPGDEATQDVDLLVSRVLESTRPGSIILLHDGGQEKPGTVKATERIIEALHARGYRFVTVSELLAARKAGRT
jgi:peptidoglycan/xylan/chitin deacetylase (PgdA/CDA1 family)